MRPSISWQTILHHLMGNKASLVGSCIIIVILFCAIFAQSIAPFDPVKENLIGRLSPPTLMHPFGTDELGRDILSRVIYGARVSLLVCILATIFAMAIGMIVGLTSGYLGGMVDMALMRLVDIMLAFPSLLLAIGISCALGYGYLSLVLSLSLVGWTGFARVVRGMVIVIKEEPFIEVATSLGSSKVRILLVHILPHTLPILVVMGVLKMSTFLLAEGGLSFLGLGLQPPTPSWGGMVSQGADFICLAPWMSLFPGGAIALTVVAFNLLGEGFRDLVSIEEKG